MTEIAPEQEQLSGLGLLITQLREAIKGVNLQPTFKRAVLTALILGMGGCGTTGSVVVTDRANKFNKGIPAECRVKGSTTNSVDDNDTPLTTGKIVCDLD